ncbi:hypothetical protein E3T54_11810 [Cryobacterium sp. Sr8]|uniref:CFI-box-CTERM domain-containing protein n=1 Tax=Cryobacterium sp. Sr8 TaxID=1259203 RepID=UPI00106AE556|nr:CFI-box-CTERM domain-containing protein [Cryobacterium sp. Sr8]TFD75411.1 hypothetical protein E3T54_11810 [Cryobacterium sp. Sr8]
MIGLTPEVQKIERRIREAPEVRDLDPFGQLRRYQVASIFVLIDLLTATIHPDLFDKFLRPLETDAERGDVGARAQLRLLKIWTAGTHSTALAASDAELSGMQASGRELLGQLFLVATMSDVQTKEPRFATLYETLTRLDAEYNFLAAACVVYLDTAFQDAQSAAATRGSVGAPQPGKSAPERSTSGGGGCYIATSVYGSYDCPQVWALRRWRDSVLSPTWHGKAAIRLYYAVSPGLVRAVGRRAWFVFITRKPLDRLVARLIEQGVSDGPYQDL